MMLEDPWSWTEPPALTEPSAQAERDMLRRLVGWALVILCLVAAGVAVSLHG